MDNANPLRKDGKGIAKGGPHRGGSEGRELGVEGWCVEDGAHRSWSVRVRDLWGRSPLEGLPWGARDFLQTRFGTAGGNRHSLPMRALQQLFVRKPGAVQRVYGSDVRPGGLGHAGVSEERRQQEMGQV